MRILVTGGAGFIGSHLVDALILEGHFVRVLDSLDPQVHGDRGDVIVKNLHHHLGIGGHQDYIDFWHGDVSKPEDVRSALADIDVVFHEAAAVGVGQSMYQIVDYTRNNTMAAAVLLEEIVKRKGQIKRMIVASSMSIYGEGLYCCSHCANGLITYEFYPQPRPESQLALKQWEMLCSNCGKSSEMLPTRENKPLNPTSIYAINKRDHEEMFLVTGKAYGIPTIALRYFNVYGSRQSLSNPYTGVAAIFASQILNGNPPKIYEDGLQSRDFVHVSDIVQANMLALKATDKAWFKAFNIGTGKAQTIRGIAEALAEEMEKDKSYTILDRARAGDIRHCIADISRAKKLLGYEPKVDFVTQGIKELVEWAKDQKPEDKTDQAAKELAVRGLG